MSTVLTFKPASRRPGETARVSIPCEIVIFPGVRIERHDVDLSYRIRDTAGREEFNDFAHRRGPRGTI